MKIVFWGTPDFAVESLKKILASNHEVLAVVTVPDTEKGRGLHVSYSPVKKFALENNLPVLQPLSFKDEAFIETLKQINADLYVVVAFRILPKEVFTIPPFGSFNLHGSLLPKYRGAAPIQWALINGDTVSGVTTFKLADKVDTGNVYLMKEIPVLESDNFETLHDKLAVLGSEAVIETIDGIEAGNLTLLPQNNELATPAPKITKEICEVKWDKSAVATLNLIRGVTPFPGAYFVKDGILYKIHKARVNSTQSLAPGEFKSDKESLYVGCNPGTLEILEIQKEGRKRISIPEFLRGYQI